MKKTIAVLLLLCFSVILCSCNGIFDGDNQNKGVGNYGNSGEGDCPLLTVESLDEYKKLLKNDELPSDFVTYEQIKTIGEFSGVVFLSNAYGNDYGKDYSWYMYNLVDASGCALSLYIHHNASIDSSVLPEKITKSGKSQDMRRLDEKISGTCYQDGVAYRYLSGKLSSIEWECKGIHFTLAGLSDYSAVDSTFTGQLLSGKNGAAVIDAVFNAEER